MRPKNALSERFKMIIKLMIISDEDGSPLRTTLRSFHGERDIERRHLEAVEILCINNTSGEVVSIDTQTNTVTERSLIE